MINKQLIIQRVEQYTVVRVAGSYFTTVTVHECVCIRYTQKNSNFNLPTQNYFLSNCLYRTVSKFIVNSNTQLFIFPIIPISQQKAEVLIRVIVNILITGRISTIQVQDQLSNKILLYLIYIIILYVFLLVFTIYIIILYYIRSIIFSLYCVFAYSIILLYYTLLCYKLVFYIV